MNSPAPPASITFAASIAALQSAFTYPQSGGMIFTLEIPESERGNSFRLRTWRDELPLEVSISPAAKDESQSASRCALTAGAPETLTFPAIIWDINASGKSEGLRVKFRVKQDDLAHAIALELWCETPLRVGVCPIIPDPVPSETSLLPDSKPPHAEDTSKGKLPTQTDSAPRRRKVRFRVR